MDTGRYLKVPDQTDSGMDKYTASIELSNACRQFYKSRLEAAHGVKSRWQKDDHHHHPTCSNDNDNVSGRLAASTAPPKKQRNSIDEAMDKLRTEMTSLMDQDLSLMKQLLTLNETIEELKWQRRYYHSRRSSIDSSADIRHSHCSVSDTDMYDSEDDSLLTRTSLPPTCTTTITSTCQTPLLVLTPPPSSFSSSSSGPHRKHGVAYGSGHLTVGHARSTDCEVVRVADPPSVKVFHSEQDSFDSGFNEPNSEEETAV